MKIAVTSQNFMTITGHAGKTRRFLVYDVEPGSAPSACQRLDLDNEQSFHEFRGDAHPLDGVAALLTGSAGEGLVRRLGERGIRVVITDEKDPAKAVADLAQGRVSAPAVDPCGHDHGHDHAHGHDHHHEHGHGGCGGGGCHGHGHGHSH